jgi:hypothetical protein
LVGSVIAILSAGMVSRTEAEVIRIIFPNGGETLYTGETYTIIWEGTGRRKVKIVLIRDRTVVRTISKKAPNTGSFSLSIPDDLSEGSNYKIDVMSLSNREHDESDKSFSIRLGRPYTGILITKRTGGTGRLRIINKSNLDAVVVLTFPDEPQEVRRAVYVRAGEEFTTRGIKGGLYRCYFTFGEDWDRDSKRFTRNTYYFRFTDALKVPGQHEKEYIVWTVTLGLGYSAGTEKVRDSEFPFGDRKGREPKFPREPELSYTVIFTTALENRRPVNNLKEISINEKRIYLYVKWFSISLGEHSYLCEIFDGSGKLATRHQMSFTSTEASWNTWTWYNINKYIDKPGNWIFKIYLDGQKVIEKNLVVLSQ